MTERKKEKKISGHPIQIIDIEMNPKQPSRMNLTENLKHIINEYNDKNVALLSIAGPSRQGKSFLLNFIIRYLAALEKNSTTNWLGKTNSKKNLAGFPFQNGLERQTIGLWLWSRPFLIKNEKGEEIAVFVMDTQGVFDDHTTFREWSAIVGISLLTSSCLIYNVAKHLQEDVLQIFETFMQYGILAMKEDQTGEKCYQKMTFLIRDWNMPDECDYGPLGGQKFLDYRMKIKEDLPESSIRVRKTMKKCFEELNCFLMPDPGETAKGNDYRGSLNELNPKFIECLSSLMDSLLSPEQIKVKTIGGELMKGKNLHQIFQRYVDIFNSDEMPTTGSLLEATAHNVCETVVTKIQDNFTQTFQEYLELHGYLIQNKFNEINEMLTRAALMDFDKKKKIGDEKIAKKHKRRLESDLSKLSSSMKEANERKKADKSEKAQTKLLGEFEMILSKLVENKYLLHEELQSVTGPEVEKLLVKFCNIFDNNKIILEDLVPSLKTKIMQIVNASHEKNDEKIEKVKEMATSLVATCYANYEKEMSFKLLKTPNAILEDEFILTVENILREQTLKFFDENFQFPCEKLYLHFKTELEIKMNAKVEEIGKENSSKKGEQNTRVEALIENIVSLYDNEISTAIKHEASPDANFLQNQHLRLYQKYHEVLMNQAGVSDFSILTSFIQRLNSRLNETLENAKNYLNQVQNKIKLNVETQMTEIVEEYQTEMLEILSEMTIFTEQELNNKHQCLLKTIESKFEVPQFLTPEKKQLRTRLVEQLNNKFDHLNNQYQNKLEECYDDINKKIADALQQYKNQMEAFVDEVAEIDALENNHKEISKTLDEHLSKYLKKLPDQMEIQYRKTLTQQLSNEFKLISESFVAKQLETEKQIEILYRQCFGDYKNKIMEKMTDICQEELLKQWHDLFKSRCMDQYAIKVDQLKFDTTEVKTKLEDDIDNFFASLLQQSKEYLRKLEENALTLIENSLEVYKQKMEEFLMEESCDNESDFQQALKLTSLSCFTEFEKNIEGLPMNIFTKTNQVLKDKIENENHSYLDMFRQNVANSIEAKQTFLPEILSVYQKLMDEFLHNNCKVNASKLQEMHKKFTHSAVQNVPSSVLKAIFNEVKNQLQILYLAYEKDIKNQQEVRENVEECLIFWKNRIDNEMNKNSFDISEDGFISAIKESLFDEWTQKIRAVYSFSETDIRDICHELELYLDEACIAAKEKFMKKASDSNMTTVARNTAMQIYENEMKVHLRPTDFLHHKALENFHKQSIEIAMTHIHTKMQVKITPSLEEELSSLFQTAFKKYQDINRINTPVNPAIGIDLGTTFSCVAVYNAGKLTIIPNENNKMTTPSYVAFNRNGQETVGEAAKSQAFANPQNTIFDAKRLIGRYYNDDIVQADIKQWPFNVVDFSGKPKIKVNDETYWPEEISAKIVKKLKIMAEKHLGCPVENAVITVPAYFNDKQKTATMEAGKFAGLNVLGILNEPTAAAVAYSLNYTSVNARNVLIFDFGGGTFDVAVLSIHNGEINAKTVDGDSHLGGEDIDTNMVNYCVEKFKSETKMDLFTDQNSEDVKKRIECSKRIRRIRSECERQKINLTGSFHATVSLDAIYDSLDLKVEISRETFETINQDLFHKSMEIVERALVKAKIERSDIDDIVLVGGSTRIPKVQSLLKKYFRGKALNLNINADEAVARGAAIYAAILNGEHAEKLNKIKLTNVTPLSIGIELDDGEFEPLISKNTPIPTKMVKEYTTNEDNQTHFEVKIYEGESGKTCNNTLLGDFQLNGIPEGPAGSQSVQLTMMIDINGILHVEGVTSKGTVSKQLTTIKNKGKSTGGLRRKE